MKKNMKHIVFGSIIIILLVLMGVWHFYGNSGKKTEFSIKPLQVTVAKAVYLNIPIVAKATGSVIAPNMVDLKSQTNGAVEAIHFKSGEYVKKGAALIDLNNTKEKADLDVALASFTQEETQYKRYQTLYKSNNAVSLEELDTVQSLFLQAKAKYRAAEYALSLTHIVAPFSGFVGVTGLAVGSYVSQGDAMIELVDRLNLVIQYAMPEHLVAMIKLGQKIKFYSNAFSREKYTAVVTYISPNVDPDNLTFTARAKYENKDNFFAPGMSVYVTQELKAENSVLAIPESAIHTTSGGFAAYTISKGKAKQVTVKIGEVYKGHVTITEGLKEGDVVIDTANGTIGDGIQVEVSET
jgi:membrane fusion protein (multidrug efflux system)